MTVLWERKFLERSLPRNESSTGANVPRNESSRNVRSRGTKVPQERKFHRSECSTERKLHGSESSLCGLFAPGNESAEERKGLHLPMPMLATILIVSWRRESTMFCLRLRQISYTLAKRPNAIGCDGIPYVRPVYWRSKYLTVSSLSCLGSAYSIIGL